MQKQEAKICRPYDDSVWETLAQRRKIACSCTLFKAYTAERTWKCKGGRLKGPCYLRRDDHGRKIRTTKQNTDIGKHSSVNRTIELLNQLPAEITATFLCKSHNFRKRVRKVIVSEKEWSLLQTSL